MLNKLKSINNIPFLIGLGLLLLNDLYLKAEFHNWFTGKLSDFCGLFVFVSFWAALFPRKKLAVYYSTALLFALWKSPYSEPVIELFSQNLYPIARVVDITDLMALSVLPVAYYMDTIKIQRFKLHPIILGSISLFAFCATSGDYPHLEFEQPQYLLFKSGIRNFENKSDFTG